jgi:hypothetical protein
MEVADTWCSILTKHVANIVFQIFGFQNHSQYNLGGGSSPTPRPLIEKTKKPGTFTFLYCGMQGQ